MKIKTSEFKDIVNKIKSGISNKDIFEQGKGITFTGDYLMTYNDQIGVLYPFESEYQFIIPASEFIKIINRIKTKEFDIVQKDNFIISLTAGTMKAELKELPQHEDEFLDDINDIKNKEWKKLPADFTEGLKMTIFSTSQDMTKPYLTCIYVDKDRAISSDNLRITEYQFKRAIKDSFLLPASSAAEIMKHNVKYYYLDESWIYFKDADGLVFMSRIFNYDFPDVSHFFEVEGSIIGFPDTLKSIIPTVEILAEGQYDFEKRIQVQIKKDSISCLSSQEKGSIIDSIESDHFEELSFFINPNFFETILSHCTDAIYSENVILFENENFKHIISLFVGE